jgi:hypothetical protein
MSEVDKLGQVRPHEEVRTRRPMTWFGRVLLVGFCLFLTLLFWEPAVNGYKVTLPFLMTTAASPGSGIRYGVETFPMTSFGGDRPRALYRAVDPLGFIWKRVSQRLLAHSFNGYHSGVQLVFAPDGSKLFVKRGTALNAAIWSDCLDLGGEPVESCGSIPACCDSEPDRYVTSQTGIKEHSRRVEAIARAAGISD